MGSIRTFALSSMKNASRASDRFRDRADDAIDASSSVTDRLSDLIDDLQQLLGRAQKVSGQELSTLRKQMSKTLDVAGDMVESMGGEASVIARRTLKNTNQLVRAKPLQTLGLVAIAGLAIGFLISRR